MANRIGKTEKRGRQGRIVEEKKREDGRKYTEGGGRGCF